MDLVENYFQKYTILQEPVTQKELLELEIKIGITFPKDLKEFLIKRNGIQGFVGESYLRICAVNEIED